METLQYSEKLRGSLESVVLLEWPGRFPWVLRQVRTWLKSELTIAYTNELSVGTEITNCIERKKSERNPVWGTMMSGRIEHRKPEKSNDRKEPHPRADTKERIRRMAALEKAYPHWTRKKMAPFVFWDTPITSERNIRPFSVRYRAAINAVKQTLTDAEITEILSQAHEFFNKAQTGPP